MTLDDLVAWMVDGKSTQLTISQGVNGPNTIFQLDVQQKERIFRSERTVNKQSQSGSETLAGMVRAMDSVLEEQAKHAAMMKAMKQGRSNASRED